MPVDQLNQDTLQLVVVNAIIIVLIIRFEFFILSRFAEVIWNRSGKEKGKVKHYSMIDIAPKCVENYINNTISNI